MAHRSEEMQNLVSQLEEPRSIFRQGAKDMGLPVTDSEFGLLVAAFAYSDVAERALESDDARDIRNRPRQRAFALEAAIRRKKPSLSKREVIKAARLEHEKLIRMATNPVPMHFLSKRSQYSSLIDGLLGIALNRLAKNLPEMSTYQEVSELIRPRVASLAVLFLQVFGSNSICPARAGDGDRETRDRIKGSEFSREVVSLRRRAVSKDLQRKLGSAGVRARVLAHLQEFKRSAKTKSIV